MKKIYNNPEVKVYVINTKNLCLGEQSGNGEGAAKEMSGNSGNSGTNINWELDEE